MVLVCTVIPHGISHLSQDSTFWRLILENKSKSSAVFRLIQHTQLTYWNLYGQNSFLKMTSFLSQLWPNSMLNQFLGLKKKVWSLCVGLWEGSSVAAQLLRAEELWRREPLTWLKLLKEKKQHDPALIESSKTRFHQVRCNVVSPSSSLLAADWRVKIRHWKASTRVQSKAGLNTCLSWSASWRIMYRKVFGPLMLDDARWKFTMDGIKCGW